MQLIENTVNEGKGMDKNKCQRCSPVLLNIHRKALLSSYKFPESFFYLGNLLWGSVVVMLPDQQKVSKPYSETGKLAQCILHPVFSTGDAF